MPEKEMKDYWDSVYQKIQNDKASWFQPAPVISLEFFNNLKLPSECSIIDIGGGDSLFTDNLLQLGYQDITILDISKKALDVAKSRIGQVANSLSWVIADISNYETSMKYDLWHDRAAFHFLTVESSIQHYVHLASNVVKSGGYMILGTFAENGPEKCSGLPVSRYSSEELEKKFSDCFHLLESKQAVHITPAGVQQNFTFCCFQRK